MRIKTDRFLADYSHYLNQWQILECNRPLMYARHAILFECSHTCMMGFGSSACDVSLIDGSIALLSRPKINCGDR